MARLIDATRIEQYILNNCSDNEEINAIYAKIVDAPTLKAEPKGSFYDGYAYCLLDFGKDTVLCQDCKHYKQSAVADRKMCFRKDVDGIEVCYDFLPYDSCTYGERKAQEVTVTVKPQCAPPNSVDSTIYTPEGKLL